LALTQHCFNSLRKRAGHPYIHIVLDNGSKDGTVDWLRLSNVADEVVVLPKNVGIACGCNMLRELVMANKPSLVIKMDNDCEILTAGLLDQVVDLYDRLCKSYSFEPRQMPVLSPHVSGIRTQVHRQHIENLCSHEIGWTQIVGGLFHIVPIQHYERYLYDESLPLAYGNDGHFCKWLRGEGVPIGYIEDLHVAHYMTTDGQEAAMPEYFKRKRIEEVQL